MQFTTNRSLRRRLASRLAAIGLIILTLVPSWWLGRRLALFTRVCGSSMKPTLEEGQFLPLEHRIPKEIPRGTIVVIERFGRRSLIKRIIGLPNETITFQCGEVLVNQKMLYEPYLPRQVTTFSARYASLTTRADEYVVLGDNRLDSEDSREFGTVQRSEIGAIVDAPFSQPRTLATHRYRLLLRTKKPFAVTRAIQIERVQDRD
jgi:signal peptidase I